MAENHQQQLSKNMGLESKIITRVCHQQKKIRRLSGEGCSNLFELSSPPSLPSLPSLPSPSPPPPSPPQRESMSSVSCRPITASSHVQCLLSGLNHEQPRPVLPPHREQPRPVFPARPQPQAFEPNVPGGPQPQSSELSVPCRTLTTSEPSVPCRTHLTATIGAQCSLLNQRPWRDRTSGRMPEEC